jgi:hypothetical protein
VCVSERFTAASTPYQENLRHWSREGDKTGRCASRGKEMQITQTQSVEVLHSKPPAVLVETDGVLCCSLIYLVFNYLIIEVTLFCLECSIYRYMHHQAPTTLYSLR